MVLEIKELTVQREKENILCGLSLNIEEKGIFGILGADALGKTTLAQIICGCRDADSGSVLINGETINREALDNKKRVRLVPTSLVAESTCTAVEYLDFVGDALGVEPDKRYRQMKEALELVGIEDVQNKPFGELGTSARCRLALAASLIGNPECIVLDEPFAGVDPTSLGELYVLLKMLGKIKLLVLLSHKPSEVKALCQNIAVMSGGKIALSGSIAEIEEKINSTHELHITVRGNADNIVDAIKSVAGIVGAKITATEKNDVHSLSVEHYPDDKIKDKLFAALSAINAPMLSFKTVKLTLDDVYYSLTAQDMHRAEKKPATGRRNNA